MESDSKRYIQSATLIESNGHLAGQLAVTEFLSRNPDSSRVRITQHVKGIPLNRTHRAAGPGGLHEHRTPARCLQYPHGASRSHNTCSHPTP